MRRRKKEATPVLRKKGEPLKGYEQRLEGADSERIRIHSDYIDPQGNVIVRPVVIFGRDSSGDVRPAKMDTEGRLDVVGVAPEHQDDAVLDEANPASGNEFTVLDTTEFVRIITVATRVDWTGQPTPLEVRLYIDGEIITYTQNNPVNTPWYRLLRDDVFPGSAQTFTTTAGHHQNRSFFIEGRSVGVTAETTGGTVSRLRSRMKWARW